MTSDKKSLLSLTSSAEHELTPVRLKAHETISSLFRFEVEAVAAGSIDARGMLNKPACVAVNHGERPTRYFHGIVAEFGPVEQSGVVDVLYRMVLVPQLAQAAIRSDCRLFFNKTAEDIVKTILDDAGVTRTSFRLYAQPAQRKATAQYNETALHFITRLMEEEGWFYFFEHASDGHTLVVTNDNNGFATIPGATVHLGVGDTADQLTEFRRLEAFAPGKVSLRDYDFEVPGKNLKVDQGTILKHGGTANRAVFHWPALTRDTSQAKDRAKWRMEAAEAAVSLTDAESEMANLVAGGKFKLRDKAGTETPHVVREITHRAEDDSGSRRGEKPSSYSNSFTAFANTVPWRQPMTTARPRMEGLHTAIVLGPSGEEIHTDDQGRIKIRFWWDWREDATADSSDWVRVVQPWAGNQWGGQFIPRVGTEVAVAFMDADPDRPIVIGGFYNGNDKPIFPAAEKTKLGFRSRSVTRGGTDAFNEFSFDDNKGKEMVFLHAQKDMTTEVENDQKLDVDNDRTVTVKGNETVTIEQGNQATEVKLGNISIKADAGSITIEALQTITLKVGQSSVTLSQAGVEVKGMMITINGQVLTEVKGTMVTVEGAAMLTLKGGITMIN
ncbi:type VI secretion system tip protein TssI/VgrG [Enhydrobacter sp.]|jgi:type VI secretion system secreted protein VgrG|uniref:type VI secretion system Vgr family protein n=1 Tax=Enhydrobacter sp. TaxID=1894999 RepID=UPI002636F37C|nr:type VI secretion system tip protein TssI/VgrG [Enhydrobacter sp.]WIM12881.1 MAG: VgrG protein [Enhydrobacter sp.]